jgi:hypothetical protein
MFAPNAYRIRFADAKDAETLRGLAERAGQRPLVGRVLIGQIDWKPAAALSLYDGRVITEPSRNTDYLVATLRVRAAAIRAYEAMPSLGDRLRAAFAAYHSSSPVTPLPAPRDGHGEPQDGAGSDQATDRKAA